MDAAQQKPVAKTEGKTASKGDAPNP